LANQRSRSKLNEPNFSQNLTNNSFARILVQWNQRLSILPKNKTSWNRQTHHRESRYCFVPLTNVNLYPRPGIWYFSESLLHYGVQLLWSKEGEWRRLCVSAGITLFNLHRAFQYGLHPTQRDSTIEQATHAFASPSGKAIAGEKRTKLGELPLAIGTTCLQYNGRDNKVWTVTVEAIAGEAQLSWLPRLCGSSEGEGETLDKANIFASHQKRQQVRVCCVSTTTLLLQKICTKWPLQPKPNPSLLELMRGLV